MIVEAMFCLAMNIYHEAKGEPFEGQIAVEHVVLNRVATPGFPKDICGVIKEKKLMFVKQGPTEAKVPVCQFTWVCNNRFAPPRNSLAWQNAIEVAALVLSGQTNDPTYGAHFFHAANVRPGWRSVERTTRINNHIFYRKRNV